MKLKGQTPRGIRSSLISLFLVLAICSTGIGIAGAVPVLSITPSTTNVDVGANFSVFIEVDPTGYTLQQAHTDFIFDSSKVSILEVVDGGIFGTYIPGTLGDGIIDDITGVDAGVSSTCNLVEIRMQADNPGTVTIGLSDAGVGTATETLTPDINNGTVTISGAPAPVLSITPSTTNVDVGANFSVFIEVDPTGYTLQQAHTDFIFDSSKVSILEVVDGGIFGTYIPGTLGDGIIDDITGVDAGVSSTCNLVEIRMQADNPGTVTIGLSDAGVGTATETLTPDINNGTVTISGAPAPVLSITPSTTNVDVGANFSVFIEVDPTGYTLQQAHTDFIFDSSKVSILEVVDGGIFGTYIPGTLGDGIIDDITGVDAGVSSTCNLVEIRMQADNPGTVTIGLSDAGVGTATETLTPDINNGTVVVATADTTPPVITAVTNTTPTASAVIITWTTDELSDSIVKYGTVSGTYTESKSSATPVTSHSIELTGLVSETTYYFVVNSTDASDNPSQSTEHSFTTAVEAAEDTTDPSIQSVTLSPTSTVPGGSIAVTVVATDASGIASVTANGTTGAVTLTLQDTHTWGGTITAPSTDGAYEVTVIVTDASANANQASDTSPFTVAADITAPTISSVTLSPTSVGQGGLVTVTVVATDISGIDSMTANGTTGTVTLTAQGNNEWRGTITAPSTAGTYTVTVVATDASPNANVQTDTSKSFTVSTDSCTITLSTTGYTLIAMPLNDPGISTASDLADRITGCTEVIKYDETTGTFVAYVVGDNPLNDFAIVAGRGYFVNVNAGSGSVTFYGSIWT